MPRAARKQSESGIYHVMIRGIGKQNIFEDDIDKEKFIRILQVCKEKSKFELYAYCLMNNHVHLLVKETEEPIGVILKRIGIKYVYWFNARYERSGHLFQDRFKSEPVEDDAYLLTVIRYIHYNPVKGGLSKTLIYKYSSYSDYLNGTEIANILTDTAVPLEIYGREEFLDYHKKPGTEVCLDVSEPAIHPITETAAAELIHKFSRTESIAAFGALPREKQQKAIEKAHEKGASVRQLVRVTGVSKGLIERWLKN